MRRKKLTSNSIYLNCTSSKCYDKLTLIVKPEISIEKVSKYIDRFGANTTDEMMLEINSWKKSVGFQSADSRSDKNSHANGID